MALDVSNTQPAIATGAIVIPIDQFGPIFDHGMLSNATVAYNASSSTWTITGEWLASDYQYAPNYLSFQASVSASDPNTLHGSFECVFSFATEQGTFTLQRDTLG